MVVPSSITPSPLFAVDLFLRPLRRPVRRHVPVVLFERGRKPRAAVRIRHKVKRIGLGWVLRRP